MLKSTYLLSTKILKTVVAVTASLSIVLTGCSTQKSISSTDKGKIISEERIVKHAMGEAKIKGTPTKVVVLVNGMVDISLALGVKPVGAVESWLGDPWYDYIKDQMNEVTVLGSESQPNIEAIAALKPDVILGSKMRHEKIYEQLNAIAPTVMSENVFNWKENLTLVSDSLNKQEEGKKLIADWNARVADFKQKAGDKLKTQVSLIRFDPDHARIYYTGFPGMIIEDLGIARPEKQRVKKEKIAKLTKERIPEMDGDIIFNFTADWKKDGSAFKVEEEWTKDPLWKSLKAVKNNKVIRVNEVYWNMSGGVMAANKMLDDLYQYIIEEQK